ncbi:hypothetical protein Q0Z83_036080 [Actinoplanes sichuanensis]|nr:hypothetical protein Q0Z83_036080 [Actinoplanes sichuanensis]
MACGLAGGAIAGIAQDTFTDSHRTMRVQDCSTLATMDQFSDTRRKTAGQLDNLTGDSPAATNTHRASD